MPVCLTQIQFDVTFNFVASLFVILIEMQITEKSPVFGDTPYTIQINASAEEIFVADGPAIREIHFFER